MNSRRFFKNSEPKAAMAAALQASKLSAIELPFQDKAVGMLAHLDVKPTDELELQGPCSDSNEFYDNGDTRQDSSLRPPKPFLLLQGVLSRATSSSPNRGACGGRGVLRAMTMTMTMPNLHSSRSTYNRGIGFYVLADDAECGVNRGKQALRSRIEEFETLLEDL